MMKADELVEAIEKLKRAMLLITTGSPADYTDEEYAEVRKALVRHPDVAAHCPDWLRRGSALTEADSRIRREAGDEPGKWQRRRGIITNSLDPIADILEGSNDAAAVSLEKLERLGGGGFGEVFRCHHKFAKCDFALKVLNPAFDEGRDRAVARFFQEAQILFRLRHGNIVRVYDVGMIGHRPFIRMELVNGDSLGTILRRDGCLPAEDARELVRAISGALAHAHDDLRVVHRDIKPGNIMVERATNRPVLLDFGLSAFVQEEIFSRITRKGEAPAGGSYTAPELQADPTLLDPLNDVYSLGVIWYEALTSSIPLRRMVEQRLKTIPSLQKTEVELIMSCLDDVENRPMAAELHNSVPKSA
jgi:eukaryotic-like serine/threonine-protein kinase